MKNSGHRKYILFATIAILVLGFLLFPCPCWAATYRTLYTFPSASPPPASGLVMDQFGALYGTTWLGGNEMCLPGQFQEPGCGTVYQLTPIEHKPDNGMDAEWGSSKHPVSWRESVIFAFDGQDGAYPGTESLTIGNRGQVFGVASEGGTQTCEHGSCGVVFRLSRNEEGAWTEQVIHQFSNNAQGLYPTGRLTVGPDGNLYGTTNDYYSFDGPGTVFKLTRERDGTWSHAMLHSFDWHDGETPVSGVIFDPKGNIYGTTLYGGYYGEGVVYRLAPNADGTWTESVLHSFYGDDGYSLYAGLVRDRNGSLYGKALDGGVNGTGTVFQLTPDSNGDWGFKVIYAFPAEAGNTADLVIDREGALYGTASEGGQGIVFKLTPEKNGNWRRSVIHTFDNTTGGASSLMIDSWGNLYGTTSDSIFEITP
jgi:uncharacterized repeat protein (TIGR03803 family)